MILIWIVSRVAGQEWRQIMVQKLLEARGRYQRMLVALSAGNPVDLELRRELTATIDAIDKKLGALSVSNRMELQARDAQNR